MNPGTMREIADALEDAACCIREQANGLSMTGPDASDARTLHGLADVVQAKADVFFERWGHATKAVIVNGRREHVEASLAELTFERIVELTRLGGEPSLYTVTWWHPKRATTGELRPGQSVRILDGMVIDATPTTAA